MARKGRPGKHRIGRSDESNIGRGGDSKNLAIIEEANRYKEVYDLLVKGYSQQQIADKLGISRGGIASMISNAAGVMTAEALSIKEQIFVLNVMRLERLIKMGFDHLDASFVDGKLTGEGQRMYEALVRAVKTSTEIATGPDAKQVNVDQHVTLTITAGDELYKKAMENSHLNKPDVIADREDNMIVIHDERLDKLSGLIEGVEG